MKAFDEICRKTTRAICEYEMISPGDRLLIGLSGGKDSLALAHVMHCLQKRAPLKFEVVCGTFDPGFPEFQRQTLRDYAKEQGWELHVVSMDIGKLLQEKEFQDTPCVLCSRMRRGKLYGLCRELNCSKLLLAQHFDDIAVSFLMSLFRGQGITTMGPSIPPQSKNAVHLLRPFAFVPESLILEVREELQFPQAGSCRYEPLLEDKDRAYFRKRLDELSDRIPNLRPQMLRSLQNLQPEFLLDKRYITNGKSL